MNKLYRFAPLLMIATVVLLQACSAKKNTAGSRFWQALNTRYNVYYHGKTNYDEQIKIVEDEYQDDYSQHLYIHPAEARSNSKAPQPGGSFDRTIEKMQKAITLHSIKKKPKRKAGKGNDPKFKEWMKREEYNPFLHNAWYLLAKSEYMKGDFLNAAATFRYISRHFTWKQDLALEARVWEALCYCAMGWTNEADNVLAHIHIDKIENKRIRSLANLVFADYNIKDKRYEQAIPYLEQALKGTKGSQKVRLNFLLGQLYEDTGNKTKAYQAYKRAGSSNSSTYRTKFNARIKQSAVYDGYNVSGEVKALRNMTRYDRNKEYLDQIYYAIGNLYLSRGDTVHAIDNYVKAAEKSTRNGIDKAISQVTLGGIYFAQHKYDKAQPCYAEAIPQLNEDYPNYKMLKHRSDVLDELSVYSQNVTLQDSLLKLSKMPLEEQKKVIKKIIDELKKKEKEEKEAAAREEYMAQQNAQGNQNSTTSNQPQTFQINNDKSWYFYNTATKAAGKTAFQQTWGNRKLEDNWRRRNKTTFSLGDEENDTTAMGNDSTALAGDSTRVDKEALKRAEDPHYEEYYLKQIPTTEEQIKEANDIIMEGLYNMGVILKDKLEDIEASQYQFAELMRRYPDNIHRLDAYYNLYLMYMRYGQEGRAETYRNLIIEEFADSKYGQAMQDPDYLDNLKNMEEDQEIMYELAYADYLANNNERVHAYYDEMMRKYPLSKIMPKFMFIDALSYLTQKNYDKFKEVLKEMLQRYPETDITPTASSIVKQLNSGRKLTGGSTNARGMLWATKLGNDTTGRAANAQVTPFKNEPDKPHLFVLPYDVDSVNSNLLLFEVARHNFNAFVVKDYDLEQMTFGRLGLLVVKGFANYAEVAHYKSVWEEDKDMVIPDSLTQVLISQTNFNLLIDEGRSFEEYFDWVENHEDEVVESKVPELQEVKKEQEEAEKKEEAEAKAQEEKKAQEKPKTDEKKPQADEKKAQDEAAKKEAEAKKKEERERRKQDAQKRKEEKAKAQEQQPKADEKADDEKAGDVKEGEKLPDVLPGKSSSREQLMREQREKREKERAEQEKKAEEDKKSTEEKKVDDEKKVDEKKADEKKTDEKKVDEQAHDTKTPSDDAKSTRSVKDTKKSQADEKKAKEEAKKAEAEAKKAQEAAKKAEAERKKADEEVKKAVEEKKKQRDAERKKQQEEARKKREQEEKERLAAKKEADEKMKAEIKQLEQEQQARDKEGLKSLKEREKVDKARAKQLAKEEKRQQDSIKRAEKQAEKLLVKQQKARQDSIARIEKAYEDSVARADQARIEARQQKERDKIQAVKDEQQAKVDARKQAEKERKERLKQREQERKERAQERKERQKQREKERKEREKQRKAELKEKEKLQKQKQKEREEAAKQKQKEREEARKAREQERKAAAKK